MYYEIIKNNAPNKFADVNIAQMSVASPMSRFQ